LATRLIAENIFKIFIKFDLRKLYGFTAGTNIREGTELDSELAQTWQRNKYLSAPKIESQNFRSYSLPEVIKRFLNTLFIPSFALISVKRLQGVISMEKTTFILGLSDPFCNYEVSETAYPDREFVMFFSQHP
jgi:hypothetical protein